MVIFDPNCHIASEEWYEKNLVLVTEKEEG